MRSVVIAAPGTIRVDARPDAVLPGPDGAVIDAVGSDVTMSDAPTAVRAGGTVSVVGVHDLQPFPFPAPAALLRSVTLRMTMAPVQQPWPQLVPLLQSGRLSVDGIFTTELALDDAADAYRAVAARSGAVVKVLLKPLK